MKRLLGLLLITASQLSFASLTIGTYNIRNFDYDQRYNIKTNKPALATILKGLNADLLSIEEINNSAAWDNFVQQNLPGFDTEVSRCGGDHGQKLGFLFNKSKIELMEFSEDLSISEPGTPGSCDSGSRPVAIGLFKIKATGQKFFGLTVHLKSGSQAASIEKRARQFSIVKNIIQNLKAKTGVKDFYIAGDMNTTEYLSKGPDFRILNTLVADLGIRDVSSNLKCTAYYWGGTDDGIETPSMLDHVLVSSGLIKNQGVKAQAMGHCQISSCREVAIKQLGVSYESVSDHCPVVAPIQ